MVVPEKAGVKNEKRRPAEMPHSSVCRAVVFWRTFRSPAKPPRQVVRERGTARSEVEER